MAVLILSWLAHVYPSPIFKLTAFDTVTIILIMHAATAGVIHCMVNKAPAQSTHL